MGRKYLLLAIFMLIAILAFGCGQQDNVEEIVPDVILVDDILYQGELYFGIPKDDILALLGDPRPSTGGLKSETIWYDMYGDFYGFSGSTGFMFSNNKKLDTVIHSFVLDLVGVNFHGKEYDAKALYDLIESQIIGQFGNPTSRSTWDENSAKTEWGIEDQSISLEFDGMSIGLIQMWVPGNTPKERIEE